MNRNSKSRSFKIVSALRPYIHLMRLHRPVGILLCLCPALWSLSLSSPVFPTKHVILFTLGAILMRGAGCTINDLLDRRLDQKVARTSSRPLASGKISPRAACLFLALQAAGALAVLLNLNSFTIFLGLWIVIPVFLYPLFKRFTYWPQLMLGIVFNWGCLMAEASILNRLSLPIFLLYLSCIFWTLGYDTVYAFQDYADDVKIGLKSSARRLGYSKAKIFMGACYLLFLGGLWLVSFLFHTFFLTLLVPPLCLSILRKLKHLNLKYPADCNHFFQLNGLVGLLIWASILLSHFVN